MAKNPPTLRSKSRCRRRASCCSPARLRRRPSSAPRASSCRRRASAACGEGLFWGSSPPKNPLLFINLYFLFLPFSAFSHSAAGRGRRSGRAAAPRGPSSLLPSQLYPRGGGAHFFGVKNPLFGVPRPSLGGHKHHSGGFRGLPALGLTWSRFLRAASTWRPAESGSVTGGTPPRPPRAPQNPPGTHGTASWPPPRRSPALSARCWRHFRRDRAALATPPSLVATPTQMTSLRGGGPHPRWRRHYQDGA